MICKRKERIVLGLKAALIESPRILASVKRILAVAEKTQTTPAQKATLRIRKLAGESFPSSSLSKNPMAKSAPTTAMLAEMLVNLLIVVKALTNGPALGSDTAIYIIVSLKSFLRTERAAQRQ